MRVIQFLEPVTDDFVGPFSTVESAQRWLDENDRTENHVIHHLVDPAECMYGPIAPMYPDERDIADPLRGQRMDSADYGDED